MSALRAVVAAWRRARGLRKARHIIAAAVADLDRGVSAEEE